MTSNSEAVANSILGQRHQKLTQAGQRAVLDHLDQNLRVRHYEANKPILTVVTETGGEITPYEFFDDWLARHPDHIASGQPATKSTAPEPRTMTERMVATIAAQKSDRKGEAAEIASAGNPWLSSNRNMTQQARITNLDPALAAQLKQEAGVGHDRNI